ncbi:hypothetical protein WAI453_008356 [Rhynchosporium graminicola]
MFDINNVVTSLNFTRRDICISKTYSGLDGYSKRGSSLMLPEQPESRHNLRLSICHTSVEENRGAIEGSRALAAITNHLGGPNNAPSSSSTMPSPTGLSEWLSLDCGPPASPRIKGTSSSES